MGMSVRSLLPSIGIGSDSAHSRRKMTLPLYTPLATDGNSSNSGRLRSASNESVDSILLTSMSSALTATAARPRRQQASASGKRKRRMAASTTTARLSGSPKEQKQLQLQLQQQQQQQQRRSWSAYLPAPRRFWADFTLGFADGLTVPFALTAGLSSLGRTDTVLFAGLAEISAGCISMGIGGYLSARQTRSSSGATPSTGADEELSPDCSLPLSPADREGEKKAPAVEAAEVAGASRAATIADHYLAPLDLPTELRQLVLGHVAARPGLADALLAAGSAQAFCAGNTLENDEYNDCSDLDSEAGADDDAEAYAGDEADVWPVASGLSVAVGYLVGGMLPLGPYFCVSNVGHGVRWSFAVCLVALFSFGFLRDFFLEGDAAGSTGSSSSTATMASMSARPASRVPWRRFRKSLYEGLQMVVLGGIAAIVAVLCVRMFESAGSDELVPV